MQLSRSNSIIFRTIHIFLLISVTSLSMELLVRAVFSLRVGPDVFLYGTRSYRLDTTVDHRARVQEELDDMRRRGSLIEHNNVAAGYSKYVPRQARRDQDENGRWFEVTINNHGFRGRDFSTVKKAHAWRILTLGASSTFGYSNHEQETYPFVLEFLLNARLQRNACGSVRSFEVINLGIPHMKSENILSLLATEGLPLQPDVVTFYEGVNDAARKFPTPAQTVVGSAVRVPGFRSTFLWLADRLLTLKLIHIVLTLPRLEVSPQEVARHREPVVRLFLDNLRRINQMCRERKVAFVVATQQARSLYVPNEKIKGLTYLQEVELVKEKLRRRNITQREFHFLTHSELMAALREFVSSEQIPLVDVIKALDQDRDTLVSWVHLNPRGNRIVSEAFASKIWELSCPPNPVSIASAIPPQSRGDPPR